LTNREQYQKEYRERHKEQLKNWHKRYYQKHKEQIKAYQKTNRKNLREQLKKVLGFSCFICSKIPQKIHYHEIHGLEHKVYPSYILEHSKDFIALCGSCHIALHKIQKHKKRFEKLLKKLGD